MTEYSERLRKACNDDHQVLQPKGSPTDSAFQLIAGLLLSQYHLKKALDAGK